MNFESIKREPYFAPIIFGIESIIRKHDAQATSKFVDSDAKSAIRKAVSIIKGKKALPELPKDERERTKVVLSIALVGEYEHLKKTEQVQGADFINCLLAIEDSLKTRREMAGHSRGYLEFLKDFIAEAASETEDPA